MDLNKRQRRRAARGYTLNLLFLLIERRYVRWAAR
jgi:hypothetical protein